MDDERTGQVVSVEEVEELLCRLPSVQAVRVVVSDWGKVEEIHVLATTERSPKQIVRDIESSLAARWGLTIDHKRISVAQLVDKGTRPVHLRLWLLGVDLSHDTRRGTYTCRVRLGIAENETGEPSQLVEGAAEGAADPRILGRTATEATIAALNKLVDPGWVFAPVSTCCTELGQHEAAVTAVTLLTPRGTEETLVGAALVRTERANAFVRACLDAANRRLEKACARRLRTGGGTVDAPDGG